MSNYYRFIFPNGSAKTDLYFELKDCQNNGIYFGKILEINFDNAFVNHYKIGEVCAFVHIVTDESIIKRLDKISIFQ